MRDCAFVVYDLETTGFGDEARILEFAAVRIEGWKAVGQLHTLINPEMTISSRVTEVHHVTREMVRDAPTFSEVAPGIAHFLQDAVLVGHNIFSFDSRFLARQLNEEMGRSPDNWSVDTLILARKLRGDGRYRLEELAALYGIPLTPHYAMSDVYATAELWMHFASRLVEMGLSRLEDVGRYQGLRQMRGRGLPRFEQKPDITLRPR